MTKLNCLDLCGSGNCEYKGLFFDFDSYCLKPCGELLLIGLITLLFTFQRVYAISFFLNRPGSTTFSDFSSKFKIGVNFLIIFVLFVELILILLYDSQKRVFYAKAITIIIPLELFFFVLNLSFALVNNKRYWSNNCLHFFNMLIFITQIYDRINVTKSDVELGIDYIVIRGNSAIVALYFLYLLLYFVEKREYIPGEDYSQQSLVVSSDIVLHNGHQSANLFSKLSFYWTNRLMVKGSKGQLNDVDSLYILPDEIEIDKLASKMNDRLNNANYANSLFKVLNSCFGLEFYALGVLKVFADVLNFAGPLLLGYIVDFMQNDDKSHSNNQLYVYAALIFGASFFSSISTLHFGFRTNIIGLKLRGALISTLYNKLLRVPKAKLSNEFSAGELTNFVSTDVDRVVNFVKSFHDFWSLPMQICIALYLLYRQVQLAFLAGVAFALLLIPVNRLIAKKIGTLSADMMSHKDNRLKCLNEMLHGIRVVKFCAWENEFQKKIETFRQKELKSLKGRKYLDALCVYLWASAPAIVAILTFSTYIFMGYNLTAAKVFTSLALFNILIAPLNAFPWVISGVVESWVSLIRLQKFFNLEDFEEASYFIKPAYEDTNCEVKIKGGEFSWSMENGTSCFDLSIKTGTFVGILGTVGSGKSSLFSALLGEMISKKTFPAVFFKTWWNGVALVTQEPWLEKGTIKENILFGSAFDQEWYETVISACALGTDLQHMPAGDLTLVGEQGVMLSGGQKTRISLARAIYQNLDVYLLDDPLSTVDAKVAKYLFDNCIRGLLKSKTVFLITHHVHFLKQADHVIVLENGRIKANSIDSDVMLHLSNNDLNITKLAMVTEDAKLDDRVPDHNLKEDTSSTGDDKPDEPFFEVEEEKEVGFVKTGVYFKYLSAVGACAVCVTFLSLTLMQSSKNLADWWLSYWLTHQGINSSSYSTFTNKETFSLAGNFSEPSRQVQDMTPHAMRLAISLQSFTSGSLTTVITNFYSIMEQLSTNLVKTEINFDKDINFYLIVYAIIIGLNTFFTLIRSFSFAYGGLKAAENLHIMLLNKILKAPCRFFDTTPLGRIINRFSSDIWGIDDSLPFQANRLVMYIFAVLGTIVMTCYGLPLFIICVFPIIILYYRIQNYYRKTTCELKRLNSISLSPIFGHFANTLSGLIIIRAFKKNTRFAKRFRDFVTYNQIAQYSALACSTWLSIRIQAIGIFMITAVVIIAVLQHEYQNANAGLVGLAISYALSVTNILSGLIASFTETEKELISVERLVDYIKNVPEENNAAMNDAPKTWPGRGGIVFSNVNLRYAPSLPLALGTLSFEVFPGEKIGIVGRTGSGKSSIFQALFRTVEIETGCILIDKIDISRVMISDIRSRLCIIPQSPFLFSGSLRDNLTVGMDRFVDGTSRLSMDNYRPGFNPDARLDWVVEQCGLDRVIRKLNGGLDGSVGEKGESLSVGERQLVCLARALLIGSKIVCVDEATAHVDLETDVKIQQAIRYGFPDATVLTIAHRLNTIIDYDRIIVMENGQAVEFDSPATLLSDKNSYLARLATQYEA